MASLSSSWEPATLVSRASSPRDRAPSPNSRSTSPLPKAGDTATILAFRNARDTFRKSLSEKDMKRIMVPTGPEDVVNEIEKWQKGHLDSKVAAGVRVGLIHLLRFSASIDILAQGTPSPGCLLWGSIKFVLTIVQDAAQAYEQLCKALTRMIDCLPRVELYTETFLDSSLMADCVNAFYVSAIRFWAKACKFYRRHRLWNFLRVIWDDFDTEFSNLEVDMVRNLNRVESAALAEHIGQSKVATVSQQFVNSELLDAQSSTRRKEITAWLAPVAYDVEYFSNDLASARALRHPKTCVWVLDKTEVMQLCDTSLGSGKSLLWVYANPGAGKTILSSFLIDHFESEESDPVRENVLYFFCKNTDVDKNTPTAVIRSLLYQLYKSVKDHKERESLNDDLGLALDRSGQQRAVNFTVLWQLFTTHVKSLTSAIIVLDALDECQDPSQLIQGLKGLSTLKSIKVIMTSRKEPHLHNELNNIPSIEIAPEDIDADIAAFVEAKVEASSRLSHPLVRDLVITKLCNAHDGMFLWVYLMLKELKSCVSMAQVQDALAKLPTGLNGIYKSILERLRATLTRSSFDLCSKVLTWVVSAVRPLSINEIKQALTLRYDIEGDTLLTDDETFPYSDKEIELTCGSLVTVRKGTLQVIHLTVKEFLRSKHGSKDSGFSDLLVDPERARLQLTLVCLRCVARNSKPLVDLNLVDLNSEMLQTDWTLEADAPVRHLARAPLLEYASFSWLGHLTECRLDDVLGIFPTFKTTFDSEVTFCWVEACMAWQPDSTLRLLVGFDEIRDWLSDFGRTARPLHETSFQFLGSWCAAMQRLFEEYGAVLARRPWEIYLIDLRDIFCMDRGVFDGNGLEKFYEDYGLTSLREADMHLDKYQSPRPLQDKKPPHLQLQQIHQNGSDNANEWIFLVHDERQDVYIWEFTYIRANNQRLFVQHSQTGQRLPPAVDFSGDPNQKYLLISHEMSPDGRHLALVYSTASFELNAPSDIHLLTVIWRIDESLSFKRRMNCEPWASVVFSHVSIIKLFARQSRAVTFMDNRNCVTLGGMLDLRTGQRQPFPEYLIHQVFSQTMTSSVFFSCNDQQLFITKSVSSGSSEQASNLATRVAPFESNLSAKYSWKDKTKYVVDVSPTGRYLVLKAPLTLFGTDANDLGEYAVYVYDTDSSETIELPLHERFEYWDGKFHFSRHETRLIAFLIGRVAEKQMLYVNILDFLATTPRLKSHIKICSGPELTPQMIHIHKAGTSAVVVSNTKFIQRIEISDKIKSLDATEVTEDFPCKLLTVSRDGSHLAFVSYGREGGQIQLIDLTSPQAPARRLKLERSQLDISRHLNPGSKLPGDLSPDLGVLVVDAEVFDMTTDGEDVLIPFTIEGLPALLEPHRSLIASLRLRCHVSPCQSYVVYVGEGDQWGGPRYTAAIMLFRIDLKSRTSTKLELKIPEELLSASAAFHPSLPLMTLSYASPSPAEAETIQHQAPLLHLAVVDLRSLEITRLAIPESLPTNAIAEGWATIGMLPKLSFSDCGTFAYIASALRDDRMWYQIFHQVDIPSATPRFIEFSLSFNSSFTIFYGLDSASAKLELIKIPENGFWGRKNEPSVVLHDVAAYSLQLTDSELFLLLGVEDHEKMRLLIVPSDGRTPIIKTLSLTFAEARAKLEKEWQELHAKSQEQDLGKAV